MGANLMRLRYKPSATDELPAVRNGGVRPPHEF